MKNSEKFLDFQYQEIGKWVTDKGIYLAKDRIAARLAIKKVVEHNKVNIYRQIQGIHHKNLPQIYNVYESDEIGIVYEEFVQGESLKEKIEREGPCTEKEAVHVIRQICDGVGALHEAGIINRDITPENIMITQDGLIKIIDFDIARVNEKKSKDTVLMGTVDYAAPEQYGFAASDIRTDIYAVGAVLNYLLTGAAPNRQLYGKKKKYQSIIKRCIQIEKENRFGSMDELSRAIQAGTFGYHRQRFVKGLPGFRTGKTYKMCIAAIGYPLLLFWSWTVQLFLGSGSVQYSSIGKFLYLLLFMMQVFLVWIPFALLTNAGNLEIRLLKLNHFSKGKRIAIRVGLTIVSLYLWSACVASISLLVGPAT